MVRARRLMVLAVLPFLGGWGLRDCPLGIAHSDCHERGSPQARFPQDDAVCRSYGLAPDTRAYDLCRESRRHVRALTERETDFGFLQNPLLPDVR